MEKSLPRKFERLIGLINQAISQTEADDAVDLPHLTEDVNRLCEEATAAAANNAREIKLLMAELIARLDVLAARLAERKQHLATRVN